MKKIHHSLGIFKSSNMTFLRRPLLCLALLSIFIQNSGQVFQSIFLQTAYAEEKTAYVPAPPTEEELQEARERRKLWEDNNLGKDEWVPPPWTPVELEGNTVSVWGRRYAFNRDSLFPVQIESAGKDILNRGMFLDMKTEHGHLPISSGKMQIVSRTEEKITLNSTASAIGVNINIATEIEFDGMAKVTLRLSPSGQPVKIDKLAFRIPVKEEIAQYYHWCARSWDPSVSYAGKIPKEGVMGSYRWILWTGDKNRGIGWFAEQGSEKTWKNSRPYEELRLFKHNTHNDWNIRVNFIDSEYELTEELVFVFGYQATPVKPMPEEYRHLNFNIIWHWGRGYLDPIKGEHVTLNPGNTASTQEVLESPARRDIHSLPVLAGGARALSDYKGNVLPEQWLYSEEWSGRKDDRINFPNNNWAGHVYYGPARLNTSFQDFMVYYINELIQEHDLQGIYFDGHGGPLWAGREFLKRVYKLFRQRHPEQTHIFVHSSTNLVSPLLAFADFHWNGENLNAGRLRVGAHYTEVLPIDRIFAEYTGRQWGWVPHFLPELDAHHRKLIAPTREMIALLQVHDVVLSGAWCHSPTYNNFKNPFKEFGIGKTDFTGYWENPVRHNNPEIKISLYKHREVNKTLLFVSNLTDKIQETTLTLDGEQLGFSPGNVTDIENDFPLFPSEGKLFVPVNNMDYRMLVVSER